MLLPPTVFPLPPPAVPATTTTSVLVLSFESIVENAPLVATVEFVVLELLAIDVSVVVVLMVAELLMTVPLVRLLLTLTTTTSVLVAPAARVLSVSLIVLPLRLSVNAGPDVWICDENATEDGNASVRDTFCALLGPVLVTVIV